MASFLLKTEGIPSVEDMTKAPGIPSKDRIACGPVAVIECFQEIPCNPCQTCCQRNAIVIHGSINGLPELIEEKCNGCGTCVAHCPGLAIFVIDATFSQDEGLVTLPYEFLPLPKPGHIVEIADREGRIIGEGRTINVIKSEKHDNTAVVKIAVPKNLVMEARDFYVRQGDV
ncbi:MAG: 4Fe-4S binding protein [Tepidanaerobacteraceae bacterium]|jgi:Fe-S-cluster-containing hydrogenase component 2